jgi:hypothetical protein
MELLLRFYQVELIIVFKYIFIPKLTIIIIHVILNILGGEFFFDIRCHRYKIKILKLKLYKSN